MPKVQLFANWTWKISLPEPFDNVASNVSTDHYSSYCMVATKKSTLHSSLLSAILAYMEMDTSLTIDRQIPIHPIPCFPSNKYISWISQSGAFCIRLFYLSDLCVIIL